MKCAYCDGIVVEPLNNRVVIEGVHVQMLYCPYCFKILGAVAVPSH